MVNPMRGVRNYEADREREGKLAPTGYEAGEQTFIVRDFKGVNIQANRTGLEEEEFSWLENVMPIGHANLRCVPQQGTPLATLVAGGMTYFAYANINVTDYLYCFPANGSAYQVNIATGAIITVANSGTFTAPVAIAQWKNERILIVAQNGVWDWNGSVLNNELVTVTATASMPNSSNVMTVTAVSGGLITRNP